MKNTFLSSWWVSPCSGDGLENPADFDRHLLVFCQLLSSFNVRANEAEGVPWSSVALLAFAMSVLL